MLEEVAVVNRIVKGVHYLLLQHQIQLHLVQPDQRQELNKMVLVDAACVEYIDFT